MILKYILILYMTTFQGVNTYLIECSRENSKINIDDNENTNGAWSNETDMVLKRGDKISIEMVCANIRGSGTGAPTIEFSGQDVVVNGQTKGYCDTKVLLEVFFTMNNNNTYSVGLPLIHPKGGINGPGFQGASADYNNLVMPFNLNPRLPGGVINQITNYREINEGNGYVYPGVNLLGQIVPLVDQTTVSGPLPTAPLGGGAYVIYQYKVEIGGWLPPYSILANYATVGRLLAIRILPHAALLTDPRQDPPFPATRYTDWENGILKGRTGLNEQNNFYIGNHVWVSDELDEDNAVPIGSYWAGEIEYIKGFSPLGTPAFGIGVVELYFKDSNAVPSIQYPTYIGRQGGGTGEPGRNWVGGARCACYVGDLYFDSIGNPFASFNIKAGSSQEGLINYDNLDMNGAPYDSPSVGVLGRTYKPNGYLRGNNGHFLYARNTRIPQVNQTPDLKIFPNTQFNPILVSGSVPLKNFYTSTAGEYGNLPSGSEFGYRNANIVEECNNDPYIFMRNDHFGSGRLGMNGEQMPRAEPMTAFIYLSIDELLQDVNSLTAVINSRLQESLTGIGTTSSQTNNLLLNSLENPDGRQVASNVVPYYNRTGFYDKEVTTANQDTIMAQGVNAQFRNLVTDIIPVKNGGTVKITPANGTSGRDQLACNYGLQYRGIPQLQLGTSYGTSQLPTQAELDNVKRKTYLREIETSMTHTVVDGITFIPQPDLVTPQPDLVVPQPDLVTPQADLVVPQADLVIPQPNIDVVTPAVPASSILYNDTADGNVALVSDFDISNNVSPMALGNGAKLFTDDGGLGSDYSTSHTRHATFDAGGDNNCIYINIRNFEFEHSSYSMYDRLGITCGNTVRELSTGGGNLTNADSDLSQWFYKASNSIPFWSSSRAASNNYGNGYILPNKTGSDIKRNTFGGLNTWYKIDARYVRFYFHSDGSATEAGWDILVARQVNTAAVPEFTTSTPQPDLIVPQPDLIVPQPDLITPQPDLLVPQPDLITAQPPLQVIDTVDELDLIQINGFNGWANPFYGNMATADLYKYLLGDRWAALPVNDLNNLKGDTINVLWSIRITPLSLTQAAGVAVTQTQSTGSIVNGTLYTAISGLTDTIVIETVGLDSFSSLTGFEDFTPIQIGTQSIPSFNNGPAGNRQVNFNFRNVGKAIIMNTQFTYKTVNFPFPPGPNNYTGYLGSTFPNNTPAPLETTQLYEKQLIYTNIEFPGSYQLKEQVNGSFKNIWVSEDDANGTWAALAKQMRKYETYFNISSTAPSTYKLQVNDRNNWIFDGDIGMTDDRCTAQLRTMVGQPTYAPPGVYPNTTIGTGDYEAQYSDNRPAFYDWLANPEPAAIPVNLNSSSLGVTPTDFALRKAGRALICPTTTSEVFAGVSATGNIDYEEKYRFLKQLGRIKMKSRFNKKFINESLNYKGTGIVSGLGAFPVEPHDSDFISANNINSPDTQIDTSFIEKLDLGFYPYFRAVQVYDIVTNTMKTENKVFCALAVGTDYNVDYSQKNTINLGCLVWGNQIGISNSFYDNHAIIPMNNDQVKREKGLTKTSVIKPKWETIGFLDMTGNGDPVLNPSTGETGSLPLAVNTLQFTVPPLPAAPSYQKNSYDFSIDRTVPPYVGPNSKQKYRITFDGPQGPGGIGKIQGIWKQSSNLIDAVVLNFEFIKGDGIFTDTTTQRVGANPFKGLCRNASGQNTSTQPWLLSSPAPFNTVPSAVPAPPLSTPFPAWSCFGVRNTGGPDPLNPTGVPLESYEQPGGLQKTIVTTAYSAWPTYSQVTIEIFNYGGIVDVGDPIKPNLGLQHNNVNYVWTGATKPTFQYDPLKGRCEFIQLQDDNILNSKSIPYEDKSAAVVQSASAGTKACIINSASEDAVYSRNTTVEDLGNPIKSEPVKNSGVRAEISAVGIYNIFLCPENYEPPPTINLSSYWSNAVADSGDYWKKTEENRSKIIEGCVEASEENWTGSLFSRLGFQSHRELLPVYGKQKNRFNPDVYNTTKPDQISKASKPLILCNAIDNSILPALNTYYSYQDNVLIPNVNGVPMYSNGFLNNESVSIDVSNQALTASSPPILSTSPFLLIESDICQTNWRSGKTQQNILFYLMKNYQASSFIYGYGSSYTHTVNKDRVLSMINTAFRDPVTGRLQKCSNNSTIIYKIERNIIIPPPLTDINGVPLDNTPPESETNKLLGQILSNQGSAGGGSTGLGGASKSGLKKGKDSIGKINSTMIERQLVTAAVNPIIQTTDRGTYTREPNVNTGGTQTDPPILWTPRTIGYPDAGLGNPTVLDDSFKFTDIATPDPGTQNEIKIMSFVVQQILATMPINLRIDRNTNNIMPEFMIDKYGRGMPAVQSEMADTMTTYVLSTIERMGGLNDIFKFYDDGSPTATQELEKLINKVTINPETNAPIMFNPDDPFQNMNAIATFNFNGARQDGTEGGSLARLGELILQYNLEELSQEELFSSMFSIFVNQINSDRMSLSHPMGQFTGMPISDAMAGAMTDALDGDTYNLISDALADIEPRGAPEEPVDNPPPLPVRKKAEGETKETPTGRDSRDRIIPNETSSAEPGVKYVRRGDKVVAIFKNDYSEENTGTAEERMAVMKESIDTPEQEDRSGGSERKTDSPRPQNRDGRQ